jgi:FixJ family two-component response regulator
VLKELGIVMNRTHSAHSSGAGRAGAEVRPESATSAAAQGDPPAVVFVVDDDISVRESVELLMRSAGWEVQAFASAQQFLDHHREAGPGCLILDVSLPGLNGLELQKRITADRHALPIIFITGYGDVPMTVRAMKGGAAEFLTKPFEDDVLLQAVAQAVARSRETLEQESRLDALRQRYASLSRREREVMALVVAGLLNKQVGGELGISEITVKAHRGNVMRKMNAASLPDLVNMSALLGLAHPSSGPTPDNAASRRRR